MSAGFTSPGSLASSSWDWTRDLELSRTTLYQVSFEAAINEKKPSLIFHLSSFMHETDTSKSDLRNNSAY